MLPGGRSEKGSGILEKKVAPKNLEVYMGLLKELESLNCGRSLLHTEALRYNNSRAKVIAVKWKEFIHGEQRRELCSSSGREYSGN